MRGVRSSCVTAETKRMRRSARSMRLQPAKPTAATAIIAASQARPSPSRSVVQPAGALPVPRPDRVERAERSWPGPVEPARRPSPERAERSGKLAHPLFNSASSLGQSTRRPDKHAAIDLRGADEDEHLGAIGRGQPLRGASSPGGSRGELEWEPGRGFCAAGGQGWCDWQCRRYRAGQRFCAAFLARPS